MLPLPDVDLGSIPLAFSFSWFTHPVPLGCLVLFFINSLFLKHTHFLWERCRPLPVHLSWSLKKESSMPRFSFGRPGGMQLFCLRNNARRAPALAKKRSWQNVARQHAFWTEL